VTQSIELAGAAAHIGKYYVDRGWCRGQFVGMVRRVVGRWPFVGRVDELARAEAAVAVGTGVLLTGEAGIGKTALARRLAERAAAEGATVVNVAGHAVSSGAPFEAFAGVLAGDREPGPTGQVTAAEVAARVAASAGGGRLLVVVDDAGLLDEGSARALLHLATAQAAVVATVRSAALPRLVERLWRDGHCERLGLGGLGHDDVGELLETVLGGPADAAAAAAFALRSQGNPLLLRELVQAALQQSVLVRRGPGWVLAGPPPLTGGVRDLVAARLAGVDDAERACLETIAAGEPLPAGVATAVAGESLLIALEEARLVAVRQGLGGAEVCTAHPLYGEVLRADMPALRLRRLRLTLAHALETAGHPSPHDLVRAAAWRLDSGQADDPERILVAARAARGISLETAERLARHAHQTHRSLPATMLLAEILTHTGRGAEAAALLAELPPASLTPADREALAYCAAIGQGLASGDTSGGTELVAALTAGNPAASQHLHALHATMLTFDARLREGLAIALPIMTDPALPPEARTVAALAVVGAQYWLGQMRDAVAHADAIARVAAAARQAVPYGAASVELVAICALIEQGSLDAAERRGERMARDAVAEHDPFAGPRAEYCLGRVDLARGMAAAAVRRFRRCLAAVSPFDRFMARHLNSILARAAATVGDLDAATAALRAGAGQPRMKTYEPDGELAEAAVLAAALRMDEAADRAAWAAGVAADNEEWSVVVSGYHDAARYGAARRVIAPMREAAGHVHGMLASCYLDHAAALAGNGAAALDEVARRFEGIGMLLFAAEAAAEAALRHAAGGDLRAARASGQRAAGYRASCAGAVSPWLIGAPAAVPLTPRERQVAALAAGGHTDLVIAGRLHISARTVQTHLARVYAKLGISSRADLALHLR
jgi:DNA-binding CsgD family transcriptional regulator/type II secretory pathway predicted ATPase ExeA